MTLPPEWLEPVAPDALPDYGRRDVEWWWTPSPCYRVLEAGEQGRGCTVCRQPAILVREEEITRWDTRTSYSRRSFRCTDHVYQRVKIVGGFVYVMAPRFDSPTDERDAPS